MKITNIQNGFNKVVNVDKYSVHQLMKIYDFYTNIGYEVEII